MSEWTHPMCWGCWAEREGDRIPHQLKEPEVERCCFCGSETADGIYAREDPRLLVHHVAHG